jgi:uncharacterized protein YndB with AHSA1/START domain
MTVRSVTSDPHALTMTVLVDLAAPVERAWQLVADPRQLERWWGPPTWPATFVAHDLRPGGRATYYMTGPEGDRAHGWWEFTEVEAPHTLRLRDGFADEEGNDNPDLPSTLMEVTFTAEGTGCLMRVRSTFAATEAMDQLAAMGMVEGMTAAFGQIEAVLAG